MTEHHQIFCKPQQPAPEERKLSGLNPFTERAGGSFSRMGSDAPSIVINPSEEDDAPRFRRTEAAESIRTRLKLALHISADKDNDGRRSAPGSPNVPRSTSFNTNSLVDSSPGRPVSPVAALKLDELHLHY